MTKKIIHSEDQIDMLNVPTNEAPKKATRKKATRNVSKKSTSVDTKSKHVDSVDTSGKVYAVFNISHKLACYSVEADSWEELTKELGEHRFIRTGIGHVERFILESNRLSIAQVKRKLS